MLSEILLRFVDGNGTVCHRRDHLPHLLGAYITHFRNAKRGDLASSSGVLSEILLRFVDGNGTVCHRRDHLPHLLGAYITHSKDAGDAGLGGFVRNDVSRFVQRKLILHQFRGGLSADADSSSAS